MSESIIIRSLTDFKLLESQLKKRWLELEDVPNAFRYKLNVQKQKFLDGKLKFLVQLNMERSSLRRTPQTITSVVQPFNENVFNFKKVNECEILLQCQNQLNTNTSPEGIVTFLINSSPLTRFHSLVCPRLQDSLPQIITKECIEFAIDFITGLGDRSYRIGYNSLGAFASVNHLHMHLIQVQEKLFVEDAKIERIFGDIYKLDFPSFAFCLPVFDWAVREEVASNLWKITDYLCTKSIPHNIFWTWGSHSDQQLVKIFIFPRDNLTDKVKSSFNVAFCELTGYVPVGDADTYESLTEPFLIDQISAAMGPIDSQELISQVEQLFPTDDTIIRKNSIGMAQ